MHTVDTIMKDIINLRIHIAPVGFEIDRIIIPAIRMRADKVWLVVHDNVNEDKAAKYRQKIEKELEKKGIKTEIAYANRLRLFPIIKAVTEIIFKERKNDIYVNVATGSKVHAIGCMMACMLFDDRDKIHPFYAQAEKYPCNCFDDWEKSQSVSIGNLCLDSFLFQLLLNLLPVFACLVLCSVVMCYQPNLICLHLNCRNYYPVHLKAYWGYMDPEVYDLFHSIYSMHTIHMIFNNCVPYSIV